MKKFVLLVLILCFSQVSVCQAANIRIKPELLNETQTTDYKNLNENLSIIFNKLKSNIKTDKYPKYYHNYTLLKDDGTHSDTYHYVLMNGAELVYNVDTNDLRYVSFRRPELGKCRILYDYPSGNLHAVQMFSSDSKTFIYGADGKYVDYTPYIKSVEEKVLENWQMPSRKKLESQKDKEVSVQIALTVNKDGQPKKIKLMKSSNINELDDSAYDAIKKASPFDKFPEKFFNEEITIILNFNFSL